MLNYLGLGVCFVSGLVLGRYAELHSWTIAEEWLAIIALALFYALVWQIIEPV